MKKTSEYYQEIIELLNKAHEKAHQMSLEYTCHKIWCILDYLEVAQKTEKASENHKTNKKIDDSVTFRGNPK